MLWMLAMISLVMLPIILTPHLKSFIVHGTPRGKLNQQNKRAYVP